MKTRHIASAVGAALLALSTQAANFNFAYRAEGERALHPLQVFDDGKNTYFQFRGDNRTIPTIVTETNGVAYVSNYSVHGPYVVVPGVAASYRLQFGALMATVTPTAVRPTVVVPPPPTAAAEQPVLAATAAQPSPAYQKVIAYGAVNPIIGGPTHGSMATARDSSSHVASRLVPFKLNSGKLSPEALRVIRDALRGDGEIQSVVIVARDDQAYKDGVVRERAEAMRTAVVRFGIPEDRISVRQAFQRDGEDGARPTSDIEVTRTPSSARGSLLSGPARAALESIATGVRALVSLGALSQARAEAITHMLVNSLNAPTAMPTVSAQPSPVVYAQSVAPQGATAQPVIVAQAQVAPAAPPAPEESWSMSAADGSLRVALARWADKAGYRLDWRARIDYPLVDSIVVRGNALTAIGHVMSLLRGAKVPLSWQKVGDTIVVEG